MTISKITKTMKSDGSMSGSIRVKDGKRAHTVKFARDNTGTSEQWGASTDVLIFTYSTFEKLIYSNEL